MTTEDTFDPKPAPYPKNSTAEIESRNILLYLLDSSYIKGDIRVLDKVPNVDGTLDFTDEDNRPVGKFEIQLKTLDKKYSASPRYACESPFIAYCKQAMLPVFLVVVDQSASKAYWRHIDIKVVNEVSMNIRGDSYTLSIPVENVIDKANKDYLIAWRKIIEEERDKSINYGLLKYENKILEEKLREIDSKLNRPSNLPIYLLKQLHQFMDNFNQILDFEFPTIKQILYPNFWKIGIGIVNLEYNNVRFILFPVSFDKAQTVVRTISEEEFKEYDLKDIEWQFKNVLIVVWSQTPDNILKTPRKYSYHLLESDVLKAIEKHNLAIDDEFIANEYIVSFIDKYHAYLDLDEGAALYSVDELEHKLRYVLPMLEGNKKGYADWVTDFDKSIDSNGIYSNSPNHKKQLEESYKNLKAGVIPKVKVTITSEVYNIELIYYYLRLLRKVGQTHAKRLYKLGQVNVGLIGVDYWKTWNIDVLWYNFKLFIPNFFRLYDKYIRIHFPFISEELRILPERNTTVVCILSNRNSSKHWIEMFFLRPVNSDVHNRVLCFKEDEPDIPFDRKSIFDVNMKCIIEGEEFVVTVMMSHTLEFMFNFSPSYRLIKEFLGKAALRFFRKRTKKI